MLESEYRYERKFSILELSKQEVEKIVRLHPSIFSEIFYSRYVNNIYFDSINLANYYDNIEGKSDRKKIRVRWYGDLFGYIEKPILEIKIKNGNLGKKISIPLKPFEMNENANISKILNPVQELPNDLMIDFNSLEPTLLNTYIRSYYQSSNKFYRITIDTNQQYYKIKDKNNSFKNRFIDYYQIILELKYDQDYDLNANEVSSVLPFRMTKSSKYVNGLYSVFTQN